MFCATFIFQTRSSAQKIKWFLAIFVRFHVILPIAQFVYLRF